jgi:hypothetical protein
MATRFIIGKGELLTFDIPPPPMVPNKAHPYGLAEAKAHLVPQIVDAALEMQALPAAACPSDFAVAKPDRAVAPGRSGSRRQSHGAGSPA